MQDEIGRERENEWFLKNEKELIEKAHKAREKRLAERTAAEQAGERKRLKDLHFMRCPKCGHALAVERLDGITIDRCTDCEGLWLDANELEHLLLRKVDPNKGLLRKLLGV